MAGPFEFPEHPLSKKENPFVDAAGNNPYADPEKITGEIESNPYGTQADDFRPYQPRDHVATMRSRGPTVMFLGLCGVLAAICTVVCATLRAVDRIILLGMCSMVVSFVFGPAAWILGTQDLRAIAAGAMDDRGRVTTGIGRILGALTTIGSVFYLLYVVMRMVEQWEF